MGGITAGAVGATAHAVVSATFIWSSVLKIRRPALASTALVDFGVTRAPSPIVGTSLGAFELVVGLAGLCSALWTIGSVRLATGIILAGTLTAFLAFEVRDLLRDEIHPCFCFGITSELSWRSASRTIGLLAVLLVSLLLGATADNPWAPEFILLAGLGIVGSTAAVSELLRSRTSLASVQELFRY